MFVIHVSEWKSINQERFPNLLVRIILVGAVVTNKLLNFQWPTHKGLLLDHGVSSILVR